MLLGASVFTCMSKPIYIIKTANYTIVLFYYFTKNLLKTFKSFKLSFYTIIIFYNNTFSYLIATLYNNW